jgi:raffinose/stachyose/melibiose transport system permease protein
MSLETTLARFGRTDQFVGWAFMVPAALLFFGFVVWPMLNAFIYSLYVWNGFGEPQQFVGLANYLEAIQNPIFQRAAINVLILIAAALLIQVPLGLLAALLVAQPFRGAAFYRLVLFLPYVLAQTATGIVFTFLYDGNSGLAGQITRWLQTEPVFVLGNETLALPAIVAVIIWKYFGFSMMILVASLQSLDRSVVEAAHIDGARPWSVFRYITLPHVTPTLAIVSFFGVLGAVQMFDLIMSLTAGGPNNATQSLVTYLYSHGLGRLRIGYGSAVGVLLFLLCLAAALIFRWRGRS